MIKFLKKILPLLLIFVIMLLIKNPKLSSYFGLICIFGASIVFPYYMIKIFKKGIYKNILGEFDKKYKPVGFWGFYIIHGLFTLASITLAIFFIISIFKGEYRFY